jgi:hypothetical protein
MPALQRLGRGAYKHRPAECGKRRRSGEMSTLSASGRGDDYTGACLHRLALLPRLRVCDVQKSSGGWFSGSAPSVGLVPTIRDDAGYLARQRHHFRRRGMPETGRRYMQIHRGGSQRLWTWLRGLETESKKVNNEKIHRHLRNVTFGPIQLKSDILSLH